MGWDHNWFRKLLCPVTKNMNIAGNILPLSHFRRWLKQLCVLYLSLVLGISAKIGLNYFSLINAPDCPAPATIICHLHAASAPPTTAAAAPPTTTTTHHHLPASLQHHQGLPPIKWGGIRAPVQFIKADSGRSRTRRRR
ncbi:hypothetical protein CISG_04432 [Coccidioides immitis RMSCC 3703]|uniref:Uncharacterized protein n=1 Tax=Coccidioides immitis RMSCC 3703 TaxID=454286 RepID=A0A0J8QSZ2_COCIT|nr:hypothetical protein CISG_04432 [Coccidioides immitis RMSCC 3703]